MHGSSMSMRKEVPEIGLGDFQVIDTREKSVLVIRYNWRNNSVLFVHNLDDKPREVNFDVGLHDPSASLLVNLLTEDHSSAKAMGGLPRFCQAHTIGLPARRRPLYERRH
jgi:maltose alpha-D-glucosyltransferase / alpha-amylase